MANTVKSAQAYELLERMIIFQEIAPGSIASEAELMERSGFGRTPLREALQRLSRDNLVELVPRRGVQIPALSVEAQLKLLETRRPLEELAATLAASRARPDQQTDAIKFAHAFERFSGEDVYSFERILRGGHELIGEAAQNRFLKNSMTPLQSLSRRVWFAHLRGEPGDLQIAAKKHSELLNAVGQRDESQAAVLAHELIDYLYNFAFATIRAPARRCVSRHLAWSDHKLRTSSGGVRRDYSLSRAFAASVAPADCIACLVEPKQVGHRQ